MVPGRDHELTVLSGIPSPSSGWLLFSRQPLPASSPEIIIFQITTWVVSSMKPSCLFLNSLLLPHSEILQHLHLAPTISFFIYTVLYMFVELFLQVDFTLLTGNNFVKCKWNGDDTVGLQEILAERFS